jgi:hypothetical protein
MIKPKQQIPTALKRPFAEMIQFIRELINEHLNSSDLDSYPETMEHLKSKLAHCNHRIETDNAH